MNELYKLKIAIVDDEEHIRKQIAKHINNRLQDIVVYEFATGEELLTADIQTDIIFLDIMMADTNGMEVARVLRKRQNDAEIIFVTGMEEYVFKAFDVGAYHYLLKPIDKIQFLKVLDGVIEECGKKQSQHKLPEEKKQDNRTIIIKYRKCYISDYSLLFKYNSIYHTIFLSIYFLRENIR